MVIILSQKIDTVSICADEVFETYHFPARYKNQIHEGDTFIYYQENRGIKEQCYYFGVGTVGRIHTLDGVNYYASLVNVFKFDKKVSIYLPDGNYVEQLGYETVRKSPNPPWQNSIRPISQQAYDYILSIAGVQKKVAGDSSIDELEKELKNNIRMYFLGKKANAIFHIRDIASSIIKSANLAEQPELTEAELYSPIIDISDKLQQFLKYCETTKISYSYKMVLIMAFMKCANKSGVMKLNSGVKWVRQYYLYRIEHGKLAEKKQSIYLNPDITNDQIRKNLISNPIKALTESEYFFFNCETEELFFSPEIWPLIGRSEKIRINKLCSTRLDKYYGD